MSSFCEFCGNRLEDGQVCSCPDAVKAREGAPAAPPPPPPAAAPQAQAPAQPQTPPTYAPPPAGNAGQQAPPPQGYAPPPQGYAPPPPQPGYGQAPGYGAPPPGYGQAPYGYPPQQQQVKQTFGDVKNTITGFVKDPYGSATQANSLSLPVSLILLGVQGLCFFLMLLPTYIDMEVSAGTYFKTLFGGLGAIALIFGCVFAAVKIAKIPIDPKAALSTQAMSSIPMSAAFLVLMLLGFLGTSKLVVFLMVLVFTFAFISSVLLLEIGLRAVMPVGAGNMRRLICLAAAYALCFAVIALVGVNSLESMAYRMLW